MLKRPTGIQVVAGVGVAILFWIHAIVDEDGFLILDHINLPFHEFGHLFFGILGERMGVWGGTLFQLLVPLVVLVAFVRKGETLGVAFCAFWFGENFLNISAYIADAQAMALPLVGGGEHDWNMILSGLGLLRYCTGIAKTIKVLGWLIMFASVAFLTGARLLTTEE
jgi:hypothetical protein